MSAATTSRPAPAAALRTTRSALALLRERAWSGALLGVVVLSVIFVLLGRWQYHRHEARSARNALISANYDATPVALSELLASLGEGPTAHFPPQLEWRPVKVSGNYLNQGTTLLRNRPHGSQNGYEVLVPFQTADGPVLLVDRGWVASGSSSAAEPDDLPPPPEGEVQVVVRLRPSEPGTSRKAPAGQANRIDIPVLAADLANQGGPGAARVVGAYGVLVRESPPPQTALGFLSRPDPGLGINLAYAVQWVAFAISAYVLLGVAMVREVRRRAA